MSKSQKMTTDAAKRIQSTGDKKGGANAGKGSFKTRAQRAGKKNSGV